MNKESNKNSRNNGGTVADNKVSLKDAEEQIVKETLLENPSIDSNKVNYDTPDTSQVVVALDDDYQVYNNENVLSVEQIAKASNKKRPKKRVTPTDIANVDRYYASYNQGLTQGQVANREREGLYNLSSDKKGKTYLQILYNNFFSFFNILAFGVATVLLLAGAGFSQVFFVLIILVNVIIGIWQEFKAKIALNKLKLVSAPTARVVRNGVKISIPVQDIVLDDIIFLQVGKQIPSDSEVVRGEIEVNESMLTGESIPILKKVGMPIYSGSFVTSGNCYAKVIKVGSANYIEQLASQAKKYVRPRSELNRTIRGLIKVISIVMVPVAILLAWLSSRNANGWESVAFSVGGAIIGMIPAGMFLLTSVALFVGQTRLARQKMQVQDLYCIEMLARVNVLCLDKTGTITDGTMLVKETKELATTQDDKYSVKDIISAMLGATDDNNQTAVALANYFGRTSKHKDFKVVKVLPFDSRRKLSAVEFDGQGTYFLGAPEFVLKVIGARLQEDIDKYANAGLRVMVLANSQQPIKEDNKLPEVRRAIAVIAIEDHIREDAPKIIEWFKNNSVEIKVISGDNPLTVSQVATAAGVPNAQNYISLDGYSEQEVQSIANKYTVFGRVTPEQKSWLIKSIKMDNTKKVAMTGDGVNDILAMRESDCAISVGSGSEAARNVAHLVLMDDRFSSMPVAVGEGRQVINNIQKSASLFLMKTLMTIMLTMVVVFNMLILPVDAQWLKEYPLQTNNLLLLELLIIGVPSTFLALQSNKSIVKGRFLTNILAQSVPGGIVLFLNVLLIVVFKDRLELTYVVENKAVSGSLIAMMVLSVTFTGFAVLAKICQPLDTFRSVLLVCIFVATIACIMIMGSQFGIDFKPTFLGGKGASALNLTQVLFLLVQVLCVYPITSVISSAIKRIKI